MASSQQCNDYIGSLSLGELLVYYRGMEYQEEIKEGIIQYYRLVLIMEWHCLLDGLQLKDLANDEVDWKGSEEREVLAAIKSMNGGQSNWPRCLSLTFSPSWLIYCERRHHTCFSSLHKQGKFEICHFYCSYLEGASNVKNYGPFSLLGSFYQILAMVIVNGLNWLLRELLLVPECVNQGKTNSLICPTPNIISIFLDANT